MASNESLGLTDADRLVDDRGWVELVHAPDIEPTAIPASGWPADAEVQLLSQGKSTGGISGVIRLPRSYRRPGGFFECSTEFFLLSGALRIGADVRAYGWYEYAPAGAYSEQWIAVEECQLFFRSSGRPNFVTAADPGTREGIIAIDTDAVPWEPGMVPGQAQLVLRLDPDTGERAWLMKAAPRHVGPGLEYHTCIEESFCVTGSVWLGNSGKLRAGSYLWRPPFISHGPPFSETGMVLWAWASSHFGHNSPGRFDSPAEENRADFLQRQQIAEADVR